MKDLITNKPETKYHIIKKGKTKFSIKFCGAIKHRCPNIPISIESIKYLLKKYNLDNFEDLSEKHIQDFLVEQEEQLAKKQEEERKKLFVKPDNISLEWNNPDLVPELIKKSVEVFLCNGSFFDGKESINSMILNGSRQEKQTEWFGFFAEYEINQVLTTRGTKYGSTEFDFKIPKSLNSTDMVDGDVKTTIISKDGIPKTSSEFYLNDAIAMRESIKENGYIYFIVIEASAISDINGDFRKWHNEEIKKKSIDNDSTVKSRVYKVSTKVETVKLYKITEKDLEKLILMNQGKNSNGKPRPAKYGLNKNFEPISLLTITEKFNDEK